MLRLLGAQVYGFSDRLDGPSSFSKLGVQFEGAIGDICDRKALDLAYQQCQPTIIIHLAAEAIVHHAKENPVMTYQSNAMGTLNILEMARVHDFSGSMVMFTTDKVYANDYTGAPFMEQDPLGNEGIYNTSKACAELMIQAYYQQYLSSIGLATIRAGNVIGGGDWNPFRLIPDAVRASNLNQPLQLRMPNAIRPWQHVLESLYATVLLAENLAVNASHFSGAWNIGPELEDQISVLEVVNYFYEWLPGAIDVDFKTKPFDTKPFTEESPILRLDITKAKTQLNWLPLMNVRHALQLTGQWYQAFAAGKDMMKITEQQMRDTLPIQ